jgi:hypothetical protein
MNQEPRQCLERKTEVSQPGGQSGVASAKIHSEGGDQFRYRGRVCISSR